MTPIAIEIAIDATLVAMVCQLSHGIATKRVRDSFWPRTRREWLWPMCPVCHVARVAIIVAVGMVLVEG